MMIRIPYREGGDNSLGKIIGANGYTKQLTWEDLLWAARMVRGEAGGDTGDHGAAVLWTQASTIVAVRFNGSYSDWCKLHSQPINPRWRGEQYYQGPGEIDAMFCVNPAVAREQGDNRRGVGKGYGTEHCTPAKARNRELHVSIGWEEMPVELTNFVVRWARGEVPNPVPKSTDFARADVAQRTLQNGANFIWNSKGKSANASERTDGNTFIGHVQQTQRAKRSDNWSPNFVKIAYGQQVAQDGEARLVPLNEAPPATDGRIPVVPADERTTKDRIELMTSGRREPPGGVTFRYLVVSGSDPQASGVYPNESKLQTPALNFYNQMLALKGVQPIHLNNTVPIIGIFAKDLDDEAGEAVNLNEIIFIKTNVQHFEEGFWDGQTLNPERPLASIVGFSVKIESPSVGGPTGISVAELTLKIHNPSLVRSTHPEGKFITWMMKQGYHLKVRYGVVGDLAQEVDSPSTVNAFDVREEDFVVAQHEIKMDSNLEMEMKLTMTPLAHKLFNQMFVGEAIPIASLATRDGQIVTGQDNAAAFGQVDTASMDPADREDLKRQIASLFTEINSSLRMAGLSMHARENGTLGSLIHGVLTDSEIINFPERYSQIRVQNYVEALTSIQSSLLTRRFEKLIKTHSYLGKIRSQVDVIAVTCGTIIEEMLRHEIEYIVSSVSENAISTGFVTRPEDIQGRNSVKIVFGNFNARAGTRAGEPISTFPVDVDEMLNYVRRERQVGRFSDTINNFLGRIFSLMGNRNYYEVDQEHREGENILRLTTPQVKYSFFPDPLDENAWIFYVYDSKEEVVNISRMLEALRDSANTEPLTRDEIIDRCIMYNIPWIDFGSENSLIKSATASNTADDTIQSHNLYLANLGINQRRLDGGRLPAGINANFLGMNLNNSQRAVRNSDLILPLQVQIDHFMISHAKLFGHVFLFFPIPQFTGLYTIQELHHEIQRESAMSRLTLQINLTTANRRVAE